MTKIMIVAMLVANATPEIVFAVALNVVGAQQLAAELETFDGVKKANQLAPQGIPYSYNDKE